MKKITYVSGQYSQFKLEEGGKFFLEALPDKVKISKMIFGIIPTKVIWEFKFPFYIRTTTEGWNTSKEVIDLILDSISDCRTTGQLAEKLTVLRGELRNYVERNEERAMTLAFNKVGELAFKKLEK